MERRLSADFAYNDGEVPVLKRFSFEKMKREAAAQRRPAQRSGKNALFPRNGRPYGLKRNAFQDGQRFKKVAYLLWAALGKKSCLP